MADIAINPVTRRVQFTGNTGTGPFAFTFNILQDADITVYKNTTLLTLTTDYTISTNANGTGSITLVAGQALVSTDVLTIIGGRELSRTTDFVTGGDLLASSMNEQLDSNVIMTQQLDEKVTRSIRQSPGDEDGDMTLPLKDSRANKFLKFDATGNPGVQSSLEITGQIIGTNYTADNFTGDGSDTTFTLSTEAGSKNNMQVYIDGVYQQKNSYSLSETTLTFSEAPPNNASIEVVIGTAIETSDSATAVNFVQPSASASVRTVQNKLEEIVSVKDFGAVGGGVVDDTAALQAAVDYCTANQAKLLLDGAFKITSPIEINYANITIEGNLYGFGSVIYPHNCAAFKIDGTDKSGGYSFNIVLKDFMISGSNVSTAQDYCILLKNAYRCLFSNLRITQVPVDTSSGFSTVIKTEGTNLVNHFDRVYINGAGNTGSGRVFSIESNEASTIFMTQCDAENAFQGVYVAANSRVEMISPYFERCGTSIFIEAGTGTPEQTPHINIYGGTIDLPSSSSIGVNFNGTFSRDEIINIDGLRFSSTDHATKKNGFVTSAMTWSNDNKINITNVDWSWIDKPSGLYHSAYIKPLNPYEEDLLDIKRYTFKITSLADNTATDVFKVDSLPTANPYEPVFVRVRVWESFNGYGRALEESVFVIQDRSDTNSYVSTKQVVAAVQETDAANFSITTLEMSTTENSDNIVFKVTSDFNTAILSTMPEVYFDVEIVGTGKFTLL